MQSRKEELSSLIDTALNLENIVNFKSLHTLLHGIVDLLGGDERDERLRMGASGFIDHISSSTNYVNNFEGLEVLKARMETLERSLERLQRDMAISNVSSVNERNLAGKSTLIRQQSEANSGIRENNATEGIDSVNSILEQKIDEVVAMGEESDLSGPAQRSQPSNVMSHVETGGNSNVKTSVFTRAERDERADSPGNRIIQSISETTPHVDTEMKPSIKSNDNNSDERDINIIEIIELSPSSECQEYLHYPSYSLSDSTLRLSNLETQYEHLRDEMDTLHYLREEMKEKLSVETFESVVMQWEHSLLVMEKKFTQERDQVNDKLQTVCNCLTDVETNMINQLNGLKTFLAGELLQVDEQLRKVQRSQRKVFNETVEAAGGKIRSPGDLSCISCNRYVTMRLKEPHCLSSILAQPFTRTASPTKAIPSKKTHEKFSQNFKEKRHAGGKHTVISCHDKQTHSAMQTEKHLPKRLICVDTENSDGSSRILGGIFGVLASKSFDSIN